MHALCPGYSPATAKRHGREPVRDAGKELLMQSRFKSKSEAHTATFEWINGWRNPHRRHSSLGRLSLINFERRLITEQELRT